MSKSSKDTKTGNTTPAFLAAAASNAEGALSYMLMSAFGVSLSVLMSTASMILMSKDAQLMYLCLTAAVQIRNNVVFVGNQYGALRVKYPELVIEGSREQKDILNFGAVHALGHVLAHVSNHPLAQKILSKAGSCITGQYETDSEAGKINKEIHASWTLEDKGSWNAWLTATKVACSSDLDGFIANIPGMSQNFAMVAFAKSGLPASTSSSTKAAKTATKPLDA